MEVPSPRESPSQDGPGSPGRHPLWRPLESEYLDAVRWVESLECNQPHQDKSWIARVEENDRQYFASVRRAEGA